nr:AAA family ATPase [Bifidobacterium amazonense]
MPLNSGGIRNASVELVIKDKPIRISFTGDECDSVVRDVDIEHDALYIADPFVIDTLNRQFQPGQLDVVEQNLRNRLVDTVGHASDAGDGLGANMIRRNIAKDKLADVERILGGVIPGDIRSLADGYYLDSPRAGGSVRFENMSTGLKSFAVLKMLIERGKFGERDVLVLDEPEIHLHPEWQMKYAQVIVLLQKTFDLTVVVTTHSPYFLDAFDLYSRQYGTSGSASYYESSRDLESNAIVFEDVTGNIDAIYQTMAGPIDVLNALRDELEERDS